MHPVCVLVPRSILLYLSTYTANPFNMARGKLDHLLPAPERERAAADACAQLDALIAAFDKARASAAKDEVGVSQLCVVTFSIVQ